MNPQVSGTCRMISGENNQVWPRPAGYCGWTLFTSVRYCGPISSLLIRSSQISFPIPRRLLHEIPTLLIWAQHRDWLKPHMSWIASRRRRSEAVTGQYHPQPQRGKLQARKKTPERPSQACRPPKASLSAISSYTCFKSIPLATKSRVRELDLSEALISINIPVYESQFRGKSEHRLSKSRPLYTKHPGPKSIDTRLAGSICRRSGAKNNAFIPSNLGSRIQTPLSGQRGFQNFYRRRFSPRRHFSENCRQVQIPIFRVLLLSGKYF